MGCFHGHIDITHLSHRIPYSNNDSTISFFLFGFQIVLFSWTGFVSLLLPLLQHPVDFCRVFRLCAVLGLFSI